MDIATLRIGFLGAGKMAQAIAKGIIASGKVKERNIMASGVNQSIKEFIPGIDIKRVFDNLEVVEKCDILFIAVKPHMVKEVLLSISPEKAANKLFVSVAAGVTIASLENWLPETARVIRVMPNTPCMVMSGVTSAHSGTRSSEQDMQIIVELMSCCGIVEILPESLIHSVIGVSGSGPAYAYMAMEALADGGVKMGLPRLTARRLAAHTLMGAAKMSMESGLHTGELKDNVCSPNGTTIRAVHHLEQSGFRSSLIGAVEASANRSKELSEMNV